VSAPRPVLGHGAGCIHADGGALLPLTAAFLGSALAIRPGCLHPLTRWHLFVDLVVGPTCIYLLRRRGAQAAARRPQA
jgi:hypothetical protein